MALFYTLRPQRSLSLSHAHTHTHAQANSISAPAPFNYSWPGHISQPAESGSGAGFARLISVAYMLALKETLLKDKTE